MYVRIALKYLPNGVSFHIVETLPMSLLQPPLKRAIIDSAMPLIGKPILFVPFALAASSILALLFYFYGFSSMGEAVRVMVLPGITGLIVLGLWARLTHHKELAERMIGGLFGGATATFVYDISRLPISMSGVPVFKAISYFGTIILDQPVPTVSSEIVGWSYHLLNGIGFGIMYTAIVDKPRLATAIAWGLLLELIMLLTPYAEVFGYKIATEFLIITIGAHVIYGLGLWAGLKYWLGNRSFGNRERSLRSPLIVMVSLGISIVGVASVALSFHRQHTHYLSVSPPAYIGPHLYVTWDVLEPDRVAAMWIMKRFVDTNAHFHFVPVLTYISYGMPFDVPEGAIRRSATRSTTEQLIAAYHLEGDHQLVTLAHMTHLYEITPWLSHSSPIATQLAEEIRATASDCKNLSIGKCAEARFKFLDAWYDGSKNRSSLELTSPGKRRQVETRIH